MAALIDSVNGELVLLSLVADDCRPVLVLARDAAKATFLVAVAERCHRSLSDQRESPAAQAEETHAWNLLLTRVLGRSPTEDELEEVLDW